MSRPRTIVVTGATGRQGRAVSMHLQAAGFRVVALVRNPQAPAPRALAEAGIELAQGSMDDPAALSAAFAGAHGVFSMQNFWEAGYVREFNQAVNVLDAARDAGVEQFVYSSLALGTGLGLPHVETKLCIEALTQRVFPRAVLVRGAWFMEGFLDGYVDPERGEFRFVTAPEQKHGWVCMNDIGRFVARAFQDPAVFAATRTNLVSGFSTGHELAEAFGRALGRPITYRQMSAQEIDDMVRAYLPDPVFARELHGVFRVLREVNFQVDAAALDRLLPHPTSLDTWVSSVWLPHQKLADTTGAKARAAAEA